jgi:dTDP-4-amino-4,6-dideoxygalactose transaminase
VLDVIERGEGFTFGREVGVLEREVAAYCGVRYAVGVASGTDALLLSLLAYGIGSGDEVIVPSLTFAAPALNVTLINAKPVFVDVDERTYTIHPGKIEEKITHRTKMIIPVHLYGQSADMDEVMEVARKYDLRVVEDAAQALGAEYKGRKVGSIGDIGCLSFFEGKNLGCFGNAGMILCNDEGIIKKIKAMRAHGCNRGYNHSIVGINSGFDTIQAAVLLVKLKRLEEWNSLRRKIGVLYAKFLGGIQQITLPHEVHPRKHVYNRYVIRVKSRREELMEFLRRKGIETKVHYPMPLHLLGAFRYLGYKEGDFPISEQLCKEILSIPMFPELKEEDVKYICGAILEFYN